MQILTQEDWNSVLYNGMASTTPLAALYFVALMTFGNYVLFNLLVAILVEGFQAEVRANTQSLLSYLEKVEERMRLIELCCADDTKAAYKRIICSILSVWLSPLYPHPFLSFILPCSVPSLIRYLPFLHTFANTHNPLQGWDVFDIACHSQLVSFCCLVFIIYLRHLSLSLTLSFLLSHVLVLSPCDTHTHTRIPFSKAVCLHLSSMNFN